MLHQALQGEDYPVGDGIAALLRAATGADRLDVSIHVVLAHQVAQVRHHGTHERALLDADHHGLVGAYRHQYPHRRLPHVLAEHLHLLDPPLPVVRDLDHRDSRVIEVLLLRSTGGLADLLEPGKVDGDVVVPAARLRPPLEPLLLEHLAGLGIERRHELLLERHAAHRAPRSLKLGRIDRLVVVSGEVPRPPLGVALLLPQVEILPEQRLPRLRGADDQRTPLQVSQ